MTDDIVTRLREMWNKDPWSTGLLTEAADEIERLRNKVEIQRSILDLYSETCECDGCAPCCQYEQDVRRG